MALAFNTGLTPIDACDAVGSWAGFRHNGGGSPSPSVDTDVKKQNTGCLALKVSGTNRDEGIYWDFGSGNEVDFTTTANKHFWAWVLMTTLGLVKTQALGGIYVIAASDASGANWSKWWVEGSDTLDGTWKRIVMDMSKTRSEAAATPCTMTAVRWIGIGTKTNGTSRLDNFFVDRCDYGQAALQGYADAAGSITAAWQDFFDEDDLSANKYGIIDKRGTVYYLRGGITFGDAAQSGTFTFDDATGAVVEFEDPTYDAGSGAVTRIDAANLYTISAEGLSTQKTSVLFGDVVGSGDDRQGVQGGVIQTAGPSWSMDFATDIADLTTVDIYGLTVSGASGGILLDDGNLTSVISCIFVNCGEIDPGTTSSGAEILSVTIIDPDNYGLKWPNTAHNIKKVSFITSGTPTTQNMVHFTQSADYTTDFDGIIYYGSYASSTIRHGENTGTNADVIINSVSGSGSNPLESEFNNTASGTVTVSASYTVTVTIKDRDGGAIQNVQTSMYVTADDSEVMNMDTNPSGVATTGYTGSPPTAVYWRARKSSTGDTKYKNESGIGTITTDGLSFEVVMDVDPNA